MLERIPTVLSAKEILDKAFQRAKRIEVPDPVRYHRIRKTETARMQSVVDTIADTLQRFPDAFPNFDSLRDYQQELLDVLVGLPRLKKALGSVKWASGKVRDMGQQATKKMLRVRSVEGVKQVQRQCYGRVSSIVDEVDPDLAFLRETRDRVRVLPTISPDMATVVIAGFPNVGKSSLLRAWTKARPEVAEYAFTTKAADVGHFEVAGPRGPIRIQVVDTPGLLDRPDADRNAVERQALAALRFAADAVLFLLDASQTSGFTREQQESLLDEVRRDMAGVPLLVAESKGDLDAPPSDRLRFSTVTGEGLDELRQAILDGLPLDEPDLDRDPLEAWRQAPEEDEWAAYDQGPLQAGEEE